MPLSDGFRSNPDALKAFCEERLGLAHDSIGDVQDTLGEPPARDDAWQRARMLFQSLLHALDGGDHAGSRQREQIAGLLQDVIDKQNEGRGEAPDA